MKKILLILCLAFTVACSKNYSTIDSQAEAVKINNKNKTVIIKNEEIIVPEKVFFDFNKAVLKNEAKDSLNIVAEWLKNNNDINIIIAGHCDERGTKEYNIVLGQKRAEVTKKYLCEKGVKFSRIKTISYGKEKPEFLGSGEEVWAKNRRSVISENK